MTSFESQGAYDSSASREHAPSREEVDARNELQTALIHRYVASQVESVDDNLGPHIQAWVDTNAEKFGEVFDEMKRENPNVVALYHSNPEVVLQEVVDRMGQVS